MYRIFMNKNGMDGEATNEREFNRKVAEVREAGDTTEVYVELTQEEEAQIGADGFDLADILEDESRWVKVLDKWYAVMIDRTDDWNTGYCFWDYDEAVKIAIITDAELIAVIQNDTCIKEIEKNDFLKESRWMNGHEIGADIIRKAAEQGALTKEDAEKRCKTLDFLAICDDEDINNLYDSTAFHDITKAYIAKAIFDLADEGTIDIKQGIAIMLRLDRLFFEKSASEIFSEVTERANRWKNEEKQTGGDIFA